MCMEYGSVYGVGCVWSMVGCMEYGSVYGVR